MICEIRNMIIIYTHYIMTGDDGSYLCEKEVSLLNFMFWIAFSVFVTFIFTWWIVPLRSIKFRCKK